MVFQVQFLAHIVTALSIVSVRFLVDMTATISLHNVGITEALRGHYSQSRLSQEHGDLYSHGITSVG